LLNDHTDGHIDTIARFVAPGVAVCMEPSSRADPNRDVLLKIIRDLESFTDAKGRKLRVVKVPSPGRVLNDEGKILPASYLNFYIANQSVVVPTYGAATDEDAVRAIAGLFLRRKAVGLPAKTILNGGGAFHCITQQEPLG
jgi:agmatine deiminase